VPERHAQGLLDTSAVIDLQDVDPARLPREIAITSITLAELTAGPHATNDIAERARRQDRLQRAETIFDAIPFDAEAARAYGVVYAAVVSAGRKPRRARAVDLLIASIARARQIPLYTRNPRDFESVNHIIEVIEV